ncbi:MAG: polysaccharide biosynthesis protein [Lachnospiraceae bacterium]|nr:polysaccharide biosynthesis protein [Lachnospiraceae bacterium]
MLNLKKSTLAKGTVILTVAGLLTRVLGFFYRIWLSDRLGSELLGIYQMIFPISGVCYTIYASGIQTAISKLTAEKESGVSLFFHGLTVSLFLSLLLSLIVYETAPFLAARFLFEERTVVPLRILSFMFPFGAVTACCNGYYYGKSNSRFPAVSQLTEQIIRIVCAYVLATFVNGITFSCELAVLVLVFGEAASAVLSLISFLVAECHSLFAPGSTRHLKKRIKKEQFTSISMLALPLGFHRLIINLLHSFEATLVPYTLQQSGLTKSDAISKFGILNGMAFPFIFFPTALTGSLSVLLLPAVSRAKGEENTVYLKKVIRLSLTFSLILGTVCTVFFLVSGKFLGNLVFHEPLAGEYLLILAWLCPFLYVSSTLSSILNGLGKVYVTFSVSVLSLILKIGCLLLFVPRFGMPAYFASLLLSQAFATIAEGIVLITTQTAYSDIRNS